MRKAATPERFADFPIIPIASFHQYILSNPYCSLLLQRKRKIGNYELKRKLGTGANSTVRLGVNVATGEKRAVKIIKRGDVSDMSRLDVELKAMMMLDHPSVVKVFEVLENEDYVFFIMELCGGGSLSNYVEIKVSITSRVF